MKSYTSVQAARSAGSSTDETGAAHSVWGRSIPGFREFLDQKCLQDEISITEKAVNNIREQRSSEQKRT